MRFEMFGDEASFALRAVSRAAWLCRSLQAGASAAAKADLSPVTVADFAAQAVVSRLLLEAFPGDSLVAEEDSRLVLEGSSQDRLRATVEAVGQVFPDAGERDVRRWIDRAGPPGERAWALDPLDGTKGYLRGGQYAVALALLEGGSVVLGALACPALGIAACGSTTDEGTVAIAVRGEGSWAAPMGSEAFVRLSVSSRREPEAARLLRSYEADHTDVAKLDRIAALLGVREPPVRMDSQAKSLLLAAGEGELIFRLISPRRPDYVERIWDQAAGALIVEEAGGRVTDLTGAALDFGAGRTLDRNLGVLASNGALHATALDAVHRAGADLQPSRNAGETDEDTLDDPSPSLL